MRLDSSSPYTQVLDYLREKMIEHTVDFTAYVAGVPPVYRVYAVSSHLYTEVLAPALRHIGKAHDCTFVVRRASEDSISFFYSRREEGCFES